MSDAVFDPCRQWLGIDAVELAEPRRVLGIPPAESDPLAVIRAAEARLSRLRSVSAGPFEIARTALMRRVEEAREAVLVELAARPAVQASFSMPPPPPGGVGAMPPVPPPVPSGPSPTASFAGGGPYAATGSPSDQPAAGGAAAWDSAQGWSTAAGGMEGLEGLRPSSVRYRRPSAVPAGTLAMVAALCVVAAVLGREYLTRQKAAKPAAARSVVSREVGAFSADGEDGAQEAVPADAEDRGGPMPTGPGTDAPDAVDQETAGAPPATPSPTDTQADVPSTVGAAPPQGTPADVPPPNPVADSREPSPFERPAPQADERPVAVMAAESEPASAASTPAAVQSPDTPPSPFPSTKPREADPAKARAVVEAAIDATLVALRRKEYDSVDHELAVARKAGPDAASAARIAQWEQLGRCVREFERCLAEALNAVESGHEYDVEGSKIAIVESDSEKLIYRYKGRNRTIARDEIPAGIKLAIVEQWFDARPENQLFLGAYHLSKPEPDPAKARGHWQRARAGGADASQLMPLLDDPAFRE